MMADAAAPLPNSAATAADDAGREHDLQAAQAEHQPAHGHEALEGQLQSDQEQQEDDAQLGDLGDVLAHR